MAAAPSANALTAALAATKYQPAAIAPKPARPSQARTGPAKDKQHGMQTAISAAAPAKPAMIPAFALETSVIDFSRNARNCACIQGTT
jgi:hypothetical protein